MTKASIKRRILIIAPEAFGYTHFIKSSLDKYNQVDASIVYFDKIEFGHKNMVFKVKNLVYKSLFNINLKKRQITKSFKPFGKQDTILIIRPDLLDDYVLNFIRDKTNNFIAYYFDSAERIIRKQKIIHFFDRIYSFDKVDVKKYGFHFITNYIFEERQQSKPTAYQFFNISGYDDKFRFNQIEKMANYIKNRGWSYSFISVDTKNSNLQSDVIKVVQELKYVEEVSELISQAEILIEFQRKEQTGLSFRIFEALGHKKKLITTNQDVVNYDFYNSNNILVIDPSSYEIPESFINSSYQEVHEDILSKYRIDNWVKEVFDL